MELSIISCLRNLQVHSSMARFLSRLDHIFSILHYHSSAMIYECLLCFFVAVVANIAYYMGDLFSLKLKPVQHSFWPKYPFMLTSPLPTVVNNNFLLLQVFCTWGHGHMVEVRDMCRMDPNWKIKLAAKTDLISASSGLSITAKETWQSRQCLVQKNWAYLCVRAKLVWEYPIKYLYVVDKSVAQFHTVHKKFNCCCYYYY